MTDTPRRINTAALEPGDRVLLYTDGVVEARGARRELFGLDRFAEFVIRATAAGESAPESLRRLIHALLDNQESTLTDDATIMMIEWQQPGPPGAAGAREP
jgi:serine phosphatase RsbU (regulator of sigma subunit)